MKRQRGRGGQRKPGGYQPNRAFESNGPDVKVRGPAPHIYEKYLQLARDANSAGDRVQAENYLQHAEHYFRVMRAMQPTPQPQQYNDRFGHELDLDGEGGDEAEAAEGADGEERPQQHQQRDRDWQPRGEQRERRGEYQQREQRERGEHQQRAEQQEPREQREGDEAGEAAATSEEGGEGPRRNRRGRRNRYRDGERPARGEQGGEQGNGAVEGFGDSVPAFVGND